MPSDSALPVDTLHNFCDDPSKMTLACHAGPLGNPGQKMTYLHLFGRAFRPMPTWDTRRRRSPFACLPRLPSNSSGGATQDTDEEQGALSD